MKLETKGRVLAGLSIFFAVVGLLGIGMRLISPPAEAPGPHMPTPLYFGAWAVTVIGMVFPFVLSLLLAKFALRGLSGQKKMSSEQILREEMKVIIERHSAVTTKEPEHEADLYGNYDSRELVRTYNAIDHDAYPDRFRQLLFEIKRRYREGCEPA